MEEVAGANAVEGTPHSASLSLAVDSNGKPGLGYIIGPAEGYNVTIAYRRVGGKAVLASRRTS